MNKQVVPGDPFPTYNAMEQMKMYLNKTYLRMSFKTIQTSYFCDNWQMNSYDNVFQICFLAYNKFCSMTIPDEQKPLPDCVGITLCHEGSVFFSSDFIYCKHNIVKTEKDAIQFTFVVSLYLGFQKFVMCVLGGCLKHQLLKDR